MAAILLILRPQPGADATAARARRMGLEARVAPLFAVRPLDWEPPDPAEVDSTLLTSANGARHAGAAVAPFFDLPCYAVGEETARAARSAGFTNVRTGASDGAAVVDAAAADGMESPLHLCGRDYLPLRHPSLTVARRLVYAADPVAALPQEAAEAIAAGALVLLHSPRAASTFASLVDASGLRRGSIPVAAISETVLEAVGPGWRSAAAAAAPRDEALLELAAKLCKS